MKVKALQSFVASVGDRKYRPNAGDVLDMPDGTDWVRAGLVVAIETEAAKAKESEPGKTKAAPETTSVKPPEAAIVPKGKARDGVMSTETIKPKKGKG